jgi:adenine-specific DNA methylase
MAKFAAKVAPSEDKLRGGYYTPKPIAQFLASWAAKSGSRILEPSCGDGAILQELTRIVGPATVDAVELIADEAVKARVASGAGVEVADFFTWFTNERHGSFDAVVGNPPYIRFGSWGEEFRESALDLMRQQGLSPNRLTNAWVPFVVASVVAAREGGRIALVLPAELLQVGYAAALRSYLVDNCTAVTIVSFEKLLFPGILQEVVLLLAEKGTGPAEIRTVELPNASHLEKFDTTKPQVARAHLHETEKWTKYFLDAETISLLRAVRTDGRLLPLDTFAEVDVGVVTGRNSFFCMTETEASQRELHKFTVALVSRSVQVSALSYTRKDLKSQVEKNSVTRLLALEANTDPFQQPALAKYLEEGIADGVTEGFKCRTRRNWWQVPSTWIPDGFMLRQISTHPRIIANLSGATSTDTVHRVRMRQGVNIKSLSVGAFNSATFALSEVLGRSYGGGILELEPSECGHLPVVNPQLIPTSLHKVTDNLVRRGQIAEALDLVDKEVLIKILKFEEADIQSLRNAWTQLRDRRMQRSKKR